MLFRSGALRGDEHQHPIRVAVHEAGNRGVAILAERVFHHGGERLLLGTDRDHLSTNRVVRILRIDEAHEVRRDVDAELPLCREPVALVVGQLEDLADLLEGVDAVGELPAPVVPLLVGNVRPLRGAPAAQQLAVGADGACRVAWVYPRGIARRLDRKSTRLNSSHSQQSRMPSSA